MGRDKKSYFKDLNKQIYDKLSEMLRNGEGTSKKEAMKNGTANNKIFSYKTYSVYYEHCKYFAEYMKENHPEVTSLKKAQKYVGEYLQSRVDQNMSAWTVRTEAAALNKLYDIKPGDKDYFSCPKRERADIKRSRVDAVRDRHFSKTNNAELIKFCQGTGARREGIQNMKGKDLVTKQQIDAGLKRLEEIAQNRELTPKEQEYRQIMQDARLFKNVDHYVFLKEKGGRERLAPIIGPNKDQIVERFQNTNPDDKVWQHVSSNADIHSYRSDYANALYKEYARKIEDIPYDRVNKGTGKHFQSEVWVCRKDEKGKKLDKRAMYIASKALGHNRIEVIANNYLRGI